MDEDAFDQIMSGLKQLKSSRANANPNRWNTDGSYDKKPLDPDYFNKYYQKNLKQPFVCPDVLQQQSLQWIWLQWLVFPSATAGVIALAATSSVIAMAAAMASVAAVAMAVFSAFAAIGCWR